MDNGYAASIVDTDTLEALALAGRATMLAVPHHARFTAIQDATVRAMVAVNTERPDTFDTFDLWHVLRAEPTSTDDLDQLATEGARQ